VKLIHKLKTFSKLEWEEQLLLLEASFYLGYGRFLKSRPFAKVAPTLGEYMEETAMIENPSNEPMLRDISYAVHKMSKYTFWESECLVKAIAAMKMLERRKIESTLYLGTGKDKDGRLIAHAWLRSGPKYVTGAETMENFTIVGKFSRIIGE
jgi:Transglutaminase-like superfamily